MVPFAVWWIKKDFRSADNAALMAAHRFALERKCALVALVVIEPEARQAPEQHVRRDRFVVESINQIAASLDALNINVFIAQGSADNVFAHLASCGLKAVFSHEETGLLWTYSRDTRLHKFFLERGIHWQEFPFNGVVRRLGNRNLWQEQYRERIEGQMLAQPSGMLVPVSQDFCTALNEEKMSLKFSRFSLHSSCEWVNSALKWKNRQQLGGERVAHALLNRFLQPEIHGKYIASLSKPKDAQSFSSRLSPYLAFGCISSRQIIAHLANHTKSDALNKRSVSAFRSRLAWRCHFVQKLEDFPQLEEREQNSALAGLRPEMSSDDFQRWESGQTGYPLVDACLRSVHATGYLNFRMRAMLMSFATHLMWRDWRQPAWDLARAFLDFEPGIHFAQVQMQASVTGNNQIRIYNPLKQSLENDPHGTFIKQWVPELRDVDAGRIHALEGLPSRYPRPIVDLNLATASAKETLFKRFSESDVRIAAKQVQERLGSRSGVRSWRRKKSTKSAPSKSKPKKDNDSDITLFDLPGS